MFGEWMQAKHSMFYDALPHLFLEFDIYDKVDDVFLSTTRRKALIGNAPVVSVPVLFEGNAPARLQDLSSLVGFSVGRSDTWQESLRSQAVRQGIDVERVISQTDSCMQSEGLYLKIENDHQVLSRCKLVRRSFTQTIMDGGEHWQKRPLMPNGLREGQDMYACSIDKSWPAFRPHAST